MTKKILLDTDIGSDIDDAVCLAYLLAQPQCELLGITTVSGEPVKRAMMASAQCKLAGKEIPIYPGIEPPMQIAPKQPKCPQAAALTSWAHETEFPQNEAVDFLRRTIRAHPGEITLLTIGPLTNIAQLFTVDPEIPSLLKELVLMGGVFMGPGYNGKALEWNIICDPHAAAIVYQTKTPVHRSIGLDVTLQVNMDKEEVRQRFQTKLLRPVLDFAEVWFEQRPVITFHDPLAAATLFDDKICKYVNGAITVDLTEGDQLGRTHWQPYAANGHHEIAATVDAPRFFEHYFGVFG
jgi:purine nucleosidase